MNKKRLNRYRKAFILSAISLILFFLVEHFFQIDWTTKESFDFFRMTIAVTIVAVYGIEQYYLKQFDDYKKCSVDEDIDCIENRLLFRLVYYVSFISAICIAFLSEGNSFVFGLLLTNCIYAVSLLIQAIKLKLQLNSLTKVGV